ncbi:cytochrome c oxidase assembly protein COX16 homolog, mitochondrial-like [Chionomys nivalis]|uniref:cytochrome c oxidase assembly protein COX16 homolog, mitochondrial-like n=1 Tax=Chionomys nivalis TaxID=269649 RepID=UPI002592609A|nr:cytochrome c oxidase assembly protein COX16 homolog, mitochondrial-like [Chionomys nivalis]
MAPEEDNKKDEFDAVTTEVNAEGMAPEGFNSGMSLSDNMAPKRESWGLAEAYRARTPRPKLVLSLQFRLRGGQGRWTPGIPLGRSKGAKPAAASATVGPAVLRAMCKNKTLGYGVPMLLLVVGGSFGLREFSQIRYDAVKIKVDPELEKKLKGNKITLESEYEKIRDSTFEDWKNIRDPRPWEDPELLQGQNPETHKPKAA